MKDGAVGAIAGLGLGILGAVGLWLAKEAFRTRGEIRTATIKISKKHGICTASVDRTLKIKRNRATLHVPDEADSAVWLVKDPDGCIAEPYDRVQLRFFVKDGHGKGAAASPLHPSRPATDPGIPLLKRKIVADIALGDERTDDTEAYWYAIYLVNASGSEEQQIADPELVIEP